MKLEKCKKNRYWAVRDDNEQLIYLTVYKVGGLEVIRRLSGESFESIAKACKGGERVNDQQRNSVAS